MKTIFINFFLLFASAFLCASIYGQNRYEVKEKFAFTFTPTLLSMTNLGLQPGFQFRIRDNISSVIEIAVPITNNLDYQFEKARFFKFSSELKFFTSHSIPGRFIGFQLTYVYRKLSDLDSGLYKFRSDVRNGFSYRNATIHWPVFIGSFKWGREVVEWGNFFMDYFFTIGFRFIAARYEANGKQARNFDVPKDKSVILPDPSWEMEGNYLRPHASVGIRIGKRF